MKILFTTTFLTSNISGKKEYYFSLWISVTFNSCLLSRFNGACFSTINICINSCQEINSYIFFVNISDFFPADIPKI